MPKQITAKGKCYACLALVLFIGCLHVRIYTYTYSYIVSLNVCASASTLTCLSTWIFPCVAHFMSYSKLVPCRLVAQLLQAGLDNISEGTWSIFLYARETVWLSSVFCTIEACILPTRQQVFMGLEKGKVEREVGNCLLILSSKALWSIKY